MLVLAHVVLITIGYAGTDQVGLVAEFRTMLSSYPGMVAATVGTGLMVFVGMSSVAIARRRLPYELWYGVHLTVYAGIALAYLHQIPTGNDLTVNPAQADYWIALYCAVLALIVYFRVVVPIGRLRRYALRVDRVERESDDVVSVYVRGRNLDRLESSRWPVLPVALLRGRAVVAGSPVLDLSRSGRKVLRLTVKAVGGYTRALATVPPGTRVLVDGPLGRFTAERRHSDCVALIAGGIGVTPMRAILEELPPGDIVFVYRVVREADAVLGAEIDSLARARNARVVRLVGNHLDPGCEQFLSADHLADLIPDLSARDVFVCGPPPMMRRTIASLRDLGVPAHAHSLRALRACRMTDLPLPAQPPPQTQRSSHVRTRADVPSFPDRSSAHCREHGGSAHRSPCGCRGHGRDSQNLHRPSGQHVVRPGPCQDRRERQEDRLGRRDRADRTPAIRGHQ